MTTTHTDPERMESKTGMMDGGLRNGWSEIDEDARATHYGQGFLDFYEGVPLGLNPTGDLEWVRGWLEAEFISMRNL